MRRVLLIVLGLIAVIALAALWATRTQSGAAFVLGQVAARVPGTLDVGHTGGSFARGLTLEEASYDDGKGMRVQLARVQLTFALWPLLTKELDVGHLELAGVRVHLPPGEKQAKPFSVPSLASPLRIRVAALVVSDVLVQQATAETRIDEVRGALHWDGPELTLQPLSVRAPQWQVDADARALLAGDIDVDGRVDWRLTDNEIGGETQLSGSLRALQVTHTLGGDYPIVSRGSVALLGHTTPQVDLTHTCAAGCDAGALSVRDVLVSQTGALDDYRFEIAATIASDTLPSTQLRGDGRGTLQRLAIARLTARGAAGNLAASGALRFAPSLAVEATGQVDELDAQLLHADMHGRLAGDVTLNATSARAFAAQLGNLRGDLNGYALTGAARVTRDNARWTFDDVAASVGDNTLSGGGHLAPDSVHLDAEIDAPDLAQLLPKFGGTLAGRLALRGVPDAPLLDARLRGRSLRFANLEAKDVALDLRTRDDDALEGTIGLRGVSDGAREFGGGELRLGGTTANATAQLTWQLEENTLSTSVTATPSRDGVAATVTRGALGIDGLGTWELTAPFEVSAERSAVTVAPNTWNNDEASLAIERVVADAEVLALAATLSNMPLNPLNVLLASSLRLQGRVDASVDVRREGGQWQGHVDWQQRDTALRYANEGATETLNFQAVSLNATLAGDNGALKIDVRGDHDTVVQGDFVIAGAGTAPTVEGTAAARMSNLAWLARILPGANEMAGAIALGMRASGPLAAPDLAGRVHWREGAMSLTDLGIRLEEIEVTGEGSSNGRVTLTGTAVSGGGSVTLDGAIEQPLSGERRATLNIGGDNVKVVGWKGYEVWVTPDLTLIAGRDGTTVDGTLAVPRANVHIKELPKGAVARSADVRVDGREDEGALQMPVSGTVDLSLGEAVHIKALGLDSDVRGQVKVTLARGLEPRFDGRLYLEEGRFKAYGQDLTVERGNLFFAGSTRNPTLDVQATRRIDDPTGVVIAGVRVTGPADAYRVDLYSEPALPSTEALAYLILGRSSFDATGNDSAALSQTALALGLSRSSPITTQLASGLGLDELSVAGSNVDDAELIAGKQLNDDLYVRFTYGVFTELGALLLRYRLSDRLALEVGSADSQSVDMLYSLEK